MASFTSFSKFVHKTTKVVIDLTFAFNPKGLGLEPLQIWKILYNRVEEKWGDVGQRINLVIR